jgi:hypothetical protein
LASPSLFYIRFQDLDGLGKSDRALFHYAKLDVANSKAMTMHDYFALVYPTHTAMADSPFCFQQ